MQVQLTEIKLPFGLCTEFASMRVNRGVYDTHRSFKALATFIKLRALTTSDGLNRVPGEKTYAFFARLAKFTGVGSFNTIDAHITWCKELGLLNYTEEGNLKFISYDKIANKHMLTHNGEFDFISVPVKEGESIEHVLKTLVIKESYDNQRRMVDKNMNLIPKDQIDALQKLVGECTSKEDLRKKIIELQKHTFVKFGEVGTAIYDLVHSIQCDITLSVSTLRRKFAYKSNESAMYLKSILKQLGLISVESREYLSQTCTRKPHDKFGNIVYRNYLPVFKQGRFVARKWKMADLITLNFANL